VIMPEKLSDLKIIVKGAGEMATGTAWRLHQSGFRKILMTEVEAPLAVRRLVSFCEAVCEGTSVVEGLQADRVQSVDQVSDLWQAGRIPVIVDPDNVSWPMIQPHVLIDAILAKKNLGLTKDQAPLVIAMGPGFEAGEDAHYVVETNRGHHLGRLISEGPASPDTGVPGNIAGHSSDRVLRAPGNGPFVTDMKIGDMVTEEQIIGNVTGSPVATAVDGVLRGLIRPGTTVTAGLKIGDVDPRGDIEYCTTISEKARAIGGTVLEAILRCYNVP
jgi:xanthine dehydrogenase accessory factor